MFFIPDFKYNLRLVSKLTRELSCFVSFYPDFCLFQDLSTGKVKGIGREKDGLYLMNSKNSTKRAVAGNTITKMECADRLNKTDLLLWHKRLGHASSTTMKEILGCKLGDCKDVIENCNVCLLARHTRLAFQNSDSKSCKAFQLLHMDV